MALYEYSVNLGQRVDFTPQRVQGATFGAHNHFYIISDVPDSDGGGIYAVDIISGFMMFRIRPSNFGVPQASGSGSAIEYQDLCVFDTSRYAVHPRSEGVLHLLVTDDHHFLGDDDNQWILHLGHSSPEKV